MENLHIETVNELLENKEATEMADLYRLENTNTEEIISLANEEETVMVDIVTTAIEENMEMEITPTLEYSDPVTADITPTDKKIKLCSLDNGRDICMVKEVNDSTGEVAGYYIHMEENGFPLISVGNRIKISQRNLATSTDYKIMNCLRNYDALFTEEMIKTAYERAKRYYEISKVAVKQRKDRNIIEIYAELVMYIKWMANSEIEAGVAKEDRKYFSEGNIVDIKPNELDKVLEEIEAGCSKTVFCKNLDKIGEIMDKKLIINSKNRWSYNKTGNNSVYEFVVDEDLIKMYEDARVA